jgi:hypothetical protein
MNNEVILECCSTKLSAKKKICAHSKETAEKIMRQIFNKAAEERCKKSICPDQGQNCELNHVIGLTVECKRVKGKCPECEPPLHHFSCTAKGTVDCICHNA